MTLAADETTVMAVLRFRGLRGLCAPVRLAELSSTDAMTDNSRKLVRRRAGVSVVSSTFSIRRDRCSASNLSIARRFRSSISSFKRLRAFGVVVGAREFRIQIARASACSRLPIFCFLGPTS
jgi:hypothetical protein